MRIPHATPGVRQTGPSTAEAESNRDLGWHLLRTMSAAMTAGALLGFLIGGIGGRLAMRALFLTSGPSVRGLISDDGFPIGRFDPMATLNLLLFGTVVGLIGASVYLLVRPFLIGPTWLRRLGCSVGAGVVIGALLVQPDGVDFTLLGPRWFAIALFVALPASFGWFIPAAVSRMTRPDGWFQTAPKRFVVVPLLPLLFPPLFVLLVVPTLLVTGARHLVLHRPALARAARHPVTLWAVRIGWIGAALLGAAVLAQNTVTLLTDGQ